MDEIQDPNADPTQEGQDLPKGKESNSPEPKTYDEATHKKAIEDAIAQYGDKIKREKLDPVIKERDTYKTQAEQNLASLKAIQGERDELNTRIDEMSDGDPLSPANVKLLRELKVKEQVLKDKELAHEEEWASKQEVLKRVVAQEVAEVATEVAEDYEPINGKTPAEILKSYALKRGLTTKEDIKELADTFLTKKPEPVKEPEEELVLPRIAGEKGIQKLTNERVDRMSMDEYANHPDVKARYK